MSDETQSQSEDERPASATLVDVVLDEATIGRANPDIEHERAVAIFDLLESNYFWPVGHGSSAACEYRLRLGVVEQRLVFDIRDADE